MIIRRFVRNIMEGSTKDLFIHYASLSAQKAEETLKNANLTQRLLEVINLAKTHQNLETRPETGKLLYSLASNQKATSSHREILVPYITSGKLLGVPQLEAAAEFLHQHNQYTPSELEAYAGIGVEVTLDELKATVSEILRKEEQKIKDSR